MDGNVACGDDGLLFEIAEEGDLALDFLRKRAVGAAEQDVGLDSDGEHLLDRVLGGLGLQLLRGGDPGNQRDVDEDGIFAASSWRIWRIASRKGSDSMSPTVPPISTMVTSAVGGHLAHGVLDLVGDVGNDLDGLAEIVAAALLGDDLLVDAAGGQIVVAGQLSVGEALVVAQVEVGLRAVVGDEDLAVLEGRHGAGSTLR